MAMDPRLTHEFEQHGAMLVESARVAGSYYRTLIEEHIPPNLAAQMLLNWQEGLLSVTFGYMEVEEEN